MINNKDLVRIAIIVTISRGLSGLCWAFTAAFYLYLAYFEPSVKVNILTFVKVAFWFMTITLWVEFFANHITERYVDRMIGNNKDKPDQSKGLHP